MLLVGAEKAITPVVKGQTEAACAAGNRLDLAAVRFEAKASIAEFDRVFFRWGPVMVPPLAIPAAA
jgi:hypothetical protein